MRLPLLHPSLGSLKRFADGDETADRRQVADHIATCSACRDQVASLRSLSQTARGLGEIGVPSSLIDSVRARLASREQVILPLTDSGKPVRSRWALAAAAAVALIAVGAWLFWPNPDLSAAATTGTLSLNPSNPTPGAWISVEYEPPQALAGQKELVLRARFRTERDQGYEWTTRQVVATTLEPDARGRFEGRFKLPTNAVYAAFAVETPDGRQVDSNDRRLWDLLVTAPDGRPLISAFVQQTRDLQGRNWPQALQVAQRMVAVYPDSPEAWGLLHFYEMVDLGRAHTDSTAPSDLARLKHFQARYEGSTSPDIEMGMYDYSIAVDDSVIHAYWRARVLGDTSSALPMLEYRVGTLYYRFQKDQGAAMAEGDSLWRRYHPIMPGMFEQNMVSFALQAKDTASLARWVTRLDDVWPVGVAWAEAELTKYPTLRDTGFALLRHTIDRLSGDDDSLRQLELNKDEQRQLFRAEVRRALVFLGK
ncbi:MAG TPA: hypothetical protein VMC86_10855, partial [Gemmatimonadales bacterium]|nr:hypothetical protein [Gemmatimonadales bacterium]